MTASTLGTTSDYFQLKLRRKGPGDEKNKRKRLISTCTQRTAAL